MKQTDLEALRAERRAGATQWPFRGPAEPARISSGDRLTHLSGERLR